MQAALSAYDAAAMLGGRRIRSMRNTLAASFQVHEFAEVVIDGDMMDAGTVDLVDAGLASLSMSRLGTSTFKLTEPTAAAALAWVLRRLNSPRHARHQLEQNPAFDDSEAEGRTTAGAAGQVDMDHVISCHSSRVWACYGACGEEQAAPAEVLDSRCVR